MVDNVAIETDADAVITFHKIQDLENAIKEWKVKAYNKLHSSGFDEKVIITDDDGNKFAVMMVVMNEKVYQETDEFVAVKKMQEDVKLMMDKVKLSTPFENKFKTAYYKVCKP